MSHITAAADKLPAEIAQAIEAAEAQIEFLRHVGSMKVGDQHELTVAALRPITHILGLEPQPPALRGDIRLTLSRTADGWRVQ